MVNKIIGGTTDARKAVELLIDYEREKWLTFAGGGREFDELHRPCGCRAKAY